MLISIARYATLIIFAWFLQACVAAPTLDEGQSELISSYPIVELNGQAFEQRFDVRVSSGLTSVVVKYQSYRYDYYCSFEFMAKSQMRYEIVHEEASQPIVLYRWVYRSKLWSTLEAPVVPRCKKEVRAPLESSVRVGVLLQ